MHSGFLNTSLEPRHLAMPQKVLKLSNSPDRAGLTSPMRWVCTSWLQRGSGGLYGF